MSETRKIAAILCADVVGYSRLAGADEDRILARLRALRSDLIDPTIAVHHGRVVKRTGDGLLIEFRSVVDAVRCAVEVQNAMVDRNAGVPRKPRLWRAPLAAALLILVVGGAWWLLANRPATVAAKPAAEAARLSIVVLPFANLSGDPTQDYLVDALTDELITLLARIRADSFVIARNTAMTFKGKAVDAKAIGRELGVRYVLEGSVQPSAGQMRVNAQLIDAGSGAHIWAEQFDTPRADLLQTQDAIVRHLVRAIDNELTEAESARLKRTPAANPEAEDLALQCDGGMMKAGFIGKDADAAFALCERAIAIDPKNARALNVLGAKYLIPAELGLSADLKGDFARADELISKALAADPDYALTQTCEATCFSPRAATTKPSPNKSAHWPWTLRLPMPTPGRMGEPTHRQLRRQRRNFRQGRSGEPARSKPCLLVRRQGVG